MTELLLPPVPASVTESQVDVGDGDTAADHPDVTRVVQLGFQTPEHVAITTAADGLTSDFSATASDVSTTIPTLFIARDDWADAAERWITTNLPNAEIATMPTQMGFGTAPAEFNATVSKWAL
ncbi:hypothetical protein [Homoserinimonas sp. OAct 916]|uniref:hypothetical protein n=1 Tax=Homoserinimonas sp. OAct 916 TaxID=2211450 RepID=UPI001300BAF3|nr:hypothetical protein [Homoserinimonas sp. OAct 916]